MPAQNLYLYLRFLSCLFLKVKNEPRVNIIYIPFSLLGGPRKIWNEGLLFKGPEQLQWDTSPGVR